MGNKTSTPSTSSSWLPTLTLPTLWSSTPETQEQPSASSISDGVAAEQVPATETTGGRRKRRAKTYRKKGAGSKYKSVVSLVASAPPAPTPKKKGGKKTKRSQSGRKSIRS